ncbi:peptidase domain-containing ABC transporter [Mucilaginibacter sp.]|uniref:peptidase domain-containing ABC transporter n=1 Tax=Mucilaginibacter sp. TaxID=1882438 RepID=UPI00283FB4FE|nr:peptidase domain-containing ABC transporter [Mucilaginibacter sp.]MDR3694229.1 peptidase domain-containing ABC transporter [Mucilaginibacter sp.]
MNNRFKFYRQLESLDCAPACLKMIAGFYGKKLSLNYLREVCKTNKLGTSIYSLTSGAERIGLETMAIELEPSKITSELPLPCVLLFNGKHFVILTRVNDKLNRRKYSFRKNTSYTIADPGFGVITINEAELNKKWACNEDKGVCIFFEPDDDFNTKNENASINGDSSKNYIGSFKKIIKNYRGGLFQVLFGMVLSSLLSLAFPLLTQRIVDVGIHFKSFQFIKLIFLFQIGFFISMMVIDVIKSWILLHIGAKIELNLTYDFLSKIMKLPLYFFDVKVAADLMQRISDNSRIQAFIKNQLLDFVVSIATFISLTVLMLHYNLKIYLVYLTVTTCSVTWALAFIRKREILDYRRFDATTEITDNIIETIVAMPEIRINNAEQIKKNRWENIQIKLFDINRRILALQQYQNSGTAALNTFKNLLITFLSAQQVIAGNLTLGEMLSISAITGQLNVPVNQMIGFAQYLQDAKISFARLSEIQSKNDEDYKLPVGVADDFPDVIDSFDSIKINDLSFSYIESEDDLLFKNLNLEIPKGKVTAIVGLSGSGKTTLVKLLLKFYEPLSGSIKIGNTNLYDIPSDLWRSYCGVVMQEGHVFSDSVESNIAMSTEDIDRPRMLNAARIACADSFIHALPMQYATKIGSAGTGLSTGQKQRILIARAVYKNPKILIFDEATSSLDATNERSIHENLDSFFKNKTVIIIAHRLSTVRSADKIIVMENGKIQEQDTHENLIVSKGSYYQLVKNQLELGN